MKVVCPNCKGTIVLNGLGRKPKAMPVIFIYNALRASRSVTVAARSLDCSRSYIYKVLKGEGTTPADVIKGIDNKTG